MWRFLVGVGMLALAQPALAAGVCEASPQRFALCIKPSAVDPAVRQFDFPHWVMFDRSGTAPPTGLLVFLAGTGGKPPGPLKFLDTAAKAGYRVISLAYNDEPAVAVYCPRVPDPDCSAQFRQMRIVGDRMLPDESIRNSQPEAILSRLRALLLRLQTDYPDDQWGQFLAQGEPNWPRITLAGQSQGAGMAAFIAKQTQVERVILFSSPWDFYKDAQGERRLAPWLTLPSKTEPARWYGAYHARENTAQLLAASYKQLGIPAANLRVFSKPLPPDFQARNNNPYHTQGIGSPDYAEDWAFFLKRAP
ncbi:hypothetical protein [Massilia sp. TS11]|uniref:BPSS1187 family protein n=1 Tax=Massilia sp. TS11 TaxID=2908003 RepID=UPI001EDC25ED|nr:hypothetical protein [Massilia sp. TS11]MCG2586614.1 hypothetical protein [Massilia sp. TS11]